MYQMPKGMETSMLEDQKEKTINELEFTLINCDGVQLKKAYVTVEDFKQEVTSNALDVPMLDDVIKDMTLWGVKHENTWDVAALLDFLK